MTVFGTRSEPARRRRNVRAAAGSARVSHPRLRYWTLVAFLLLCLLGGGAARPDVLSLVHLRPAAILCLAIMALSGGGWEFRRVRAPLLLVGLLALIMIAQLIPLPPQLWLGLPGHPPYAEAAAAAGFAQPWRPLSLSPDLTLNSLLALLPFLVVLVGFAGIREEQRRALLPVLICFACADGVLGAIQFVSGPGGPAYLYAITSDDSAVGFFSNRNHNAIFMAAAFPMIAAFLRMGSGLPRDRMRSRLYAGGSASLFLILMIVVTGSRAGMVIGLVSFVLSALYAVNLWRRLERRSMLWTLSAVLAPVAVIVLAISTQRALSLDRLIGRGGTDQEGRLQALPTIFRMIRQFWPLGSGFGSFDKAFRGFEPAADLGRKYLNHAHNDL